MDETQDQVPESTETIQPASEEQSETTSEEEVSNLYDLPDGRKLDGDSLLGEYQKLNSEFTKRSQRLSTFERESAERETRAEAQAKEVLNKNELLKNVDPNVAEAIKQLSLDATKEYIKERDLADERAEKDREWDRKFETAEKAHDGKDGLPKFIKNDVLAFMMEREIYDPDVAYNELHREIREDNLIKEALKGKGSAAKTENTGGSVPKKPEGKTPRTLEEAAKSAYARMTSS